MKKILIMTILGLSLMFPIKANAQDYLPKICPEDSFYENVEALAKCVEAEAGNQGLDGKRLVADVILNRAKSPEFPNTIKEVIAQPYHFSVYWNGAFDKAEPTEETWKAVKMEIKQVGYPSILYFCSNGYSKYGTPWKQIGDHCFSIN